MESLLAAGAGVAARGTEHVQAPILLLQHLLEEPPEELQREVLQRERRAVGQPQDVEIGLERAQRGDLGSAEDLARVGAIDRLLEIRAGIVGGEETPDLEREAL